MEIEITFDIEPMAIQSDKSGIIKSKKTGKMFVHHYQPKKNNDFKFAIKTIAKSKLPKDFIPFDCPVAIDVQFVFPITSDLRKHERDAIAIGNIVYKDKKPDLDNLRKGFCDALNEIIWTDDSKVCDVHSIKRYGIKPCIILKAKHISSIENSFVIDDKDLPF